MRAAIPTELLLRLMNATPEQFAAVRKALGLSADDGGWLMDDGEAGNIERSTSNSQYSTGVSAERGTRSAEFSTPHPQSLSPVEAEREAVSEEVARSAEQKALGLSTDDGGRPSGSSFALHGLKRTEMEDRDDEGEEERLSQTAATSEEVARSAL
jgi:hypothetical protein